MKKLLTLILVLLLAISLSAQVKISGSVKVGGTVKVGVSPGGGSSGRSIIFDGVNDYLSTTDSGTAVPAAQSGWRMMARIRGLTSPAATSYIFRDNNAGVLVMRQDPSGTYGSIQAYVGAGTDSTGFVAVPSPDIILLVRSNPAATEVSLEMWDLTGANHAGAQVLTATGAATNFQSDNFFMGATTGPSGFFSGKIDKFLFITGAGTYNAAAPDVLATAGDIMEWKFDSDNGNDTSGNGVNLTLNGSPVFEDTP